MTLRVSLLIDGSSQGARREVVALRRDLQTLDRRGVDPATRSMRQLRTQTAAVGGTMRRTAGIVRGMAGAFGIALGATAIRGMITGFSDVGDRARLLQSRLSLVVGETENLADVQRDLFAVAQNTRSSFEATAELYTKVARAAGELTDDQAELLRFTEIINKAIAISGTSAQEASGGIRQLGQALASGALRGDELNSVLEQMPRLAELIATGLGVTIGQLRELGANGELTAKQVFDAIVQGGADIDREFRQVPKTVGGALQQIGNEVFRLGGRVGEASGLTSELVIVLEGVRDIIGSEWSFRALTTMGDLVARRIRQFRILNGVAQGLLGDFGEELGVGERNPEFGFEDARFGSNRINDRTQRVARGGLGNLITGFSFEDARGNADFPTTAGKDFSGLDKLIGFGDQDTRSGSRRPIRGMGEALKSVDELDSSLLGLAGTGSVVASTLSDAFEEFARTGRLSFRDLATGAISELSRIATSSAIQQIMGIFTGGGGKVGSAGGGGGFLGSLLGGFGGGGSSSGPLNIIPFASGGITSGPELFPMGGRNVGLRGEAGPEAILPLARDGSGRLGVRSAGGGTMINFAPVFSSDISPQGKAWVLSQLQIAKRDILQSVEHGQQSALLRRSDTFTRVPV